MDSIDYRELRTESFHSSKPTDSSETHPYITTITMYHNTNLPLLNLNLAPNPTFPHPPTPLCTHPNTPNSPTSRPKANLPPHTDPASHSTHDLIHPTNSHSRSTPRGICVPPKAGLTKRDASHLTRSGRGLSMNIEYRFVGPYRCRGSGRLP